MRVALGVLAALVVVGAAGSWIAWRGSQARQHLEAARTLLPQLQAAWSTGDTTAGSRLIAQVQSESAAARKETHDPVWWLAGAVPFLGEPVATTRGLAEAVDDLARRSLPNLAAAADVARPERLAVGPATIDVARLSRASSALTAASASLEQERAQVSGLAPSYLGAVAAARQQLLDKLGPVAATAREASVAARILPAMLGADGPRRYFLGFQNPAESRGTGGLLDAFAILTATDGKVSVAKVGSNRDLPPLPARIPGLDQAYVDQYQGQGALSLWIDSNLSPDFPEVARGWAALWKASTGQRVDGAFALDPSALAAVLGVTGPVQVDGVGEVSAQSLTPLVVSRQYSLSQDVAQRKSVMLGVGTQTIDALLSGRGDRSQLLDALTQAARAGHVMVFSSTAAEQQAISAAGVSGAVPAVPGPFVQTVTVNAAGSKLDTYLAVATHYAVTRCTPTARTSTVTVTLTNRAPATGLPPYVTLRADEPSPPVPLGQNRLNVQVLLAKGATVAKATLDGKPLQPPTPLGQAPKSLIIGAAGVLGAGTQAGHPSFGLDLEAPVAATRTLVLDVTEPPSGQPPLMPRQPMLTAPTVSADTAQCAAFQ